MDENGCAGPVFSASLRFACPPGKENWPWFDPAVEPGGPSCPEAVAGFAPVYNWVTKLHEADRRICFGFELDAATAASGPAAVHFQHYEKLHLAEEFCKRMGDPDTGKLYLDLAERMPAEWRPSFLVCSGDVPVPCCKRLSTGI